MAQISLVDRNYTRTLNNIIDYGSEIESRNAKTKRLLNLTFDFDSTPLISIRRTAWKNALREFEWFMSGSNDINDLHDKVKSWWEPWANEDGKILNNYGEQLRTFSGYNSCVDQVQYMIDTLKKDPNSRRNVITTWNTADMIAPETPITNCHGSLIMAAVEPDNKVRLTMVQRSCDMVLGVPHNFIQYWAFLMYLSHQTGREVGSLTWMGHDCHVYPDHIQAVKEMKKVYRDNSSSRGMQLPIYKTPDLVYTPTSNEFKANDFSLDMKYEPLIKKSLKMTV